MNRLLILKMKDSYKKIFSTPWMDPGKAGKTHLLLFGLLTLFYLITSAMLPLFDLDEGAFSEATREMVSGGDYVTTYLNGHLRFDKPILTYWLQALSAWLSGWNSFSMRLPSVLAFLGWLFALYVFVRQNLGNRHGFFAGVIMATSLQVSIIARAAIADALLNLFIALSMFAIYRYFKSENKKDIRFAFLFVALGSLTKGPVALLIPLAVSLIFFFSRKRHVLFFKALVDIPGIVIFLLVAAPWYILEYLAQGQAFLRGFFLHHNVERFQGTFEGHGGGFLYYIPVVFVGIMPFTGYLLYTIHKSVSSLFSRSVRLFFDRDLTIFLWIWALFVFVFFSLSGTKLPHYMIYGYTPLFMLTAAIMGGEERSLRMWSWPPVIVLLVALFLLPEVVKYLPRKGLDAYAIAVMNELPLHMGAFFRLTVLLLAAIFFGSEILLWKKMEAFLVIQGGAFLVFISLVMMPLASELLQRPVYEAAQISREQGYKVVQWKVNYPSFSFYSQRTTQRRTPLDGEIALTREHHLHLLQSYDVLYKKYGIVLIRLLHTERTPEWLIREAQD